MQKDNKYKPFKKDYASKSSFCGPAVQEEIFPASCEVLKVFIITVSKVTLQLIKCASANTAHTLLNMQILYNANNVLVLLP